MEFLSAFELLILCLRGKDPRLTPYTRQTGLFTMVLLLSAVAFACLAVLASTEGVDISDVYIAFAFIFFFGPSQSPTTYTMLFGRCLTKLGVFNPFNQREQGVPMNVRYITER